MFENARPVQASEQAEWFTGELLLFGLLGKLLYTLPEAGWYRSLVAEDVFADLPFAADQSDAAAAVQRLQTWRAGLGADLGDEAFDALQVDYNRLFAGPGHILAPLWESVHFSEERMLFQEQTSQVRHWYERFGLAPSSAVREPEDHLGLELAFLAQLAAMGLKALDEQRPAEVDQLLAAQHQFLREHPLRWVPTWYGLVEQNARTEFWRAVAQLTNGAVQAVADHLDWERPLELAR
ncbi:MAG: molecular chaperone TorD family protein [Anaerolineales bacterium]